MRMTRLVAAIGIVSALVLAGGITAGLILARDQAPPAPAPMASEAAAPTPGAPVVDDAGQTPRRAAAGPATPTPAPTGAPTAITEEALSKLKERDEASKSASPGDGANEQALPIPDKGELKYPNLGSNLDQLVVSVEEKETTAEEAAADSPVQREESVAVTIYLSGNVDDVVSFLEENGGDPRNVGEDYIEAYVPVSLLGPVSEQTGVIRVREIVPPQPGQGG